MNRGWRYRVTSAVGAVSLIASAVLVANHPAVQSTSMAVPVYNNLPETVLTGEELAISLATTLLVAGGFMIPLFKPRPRRVLGTIALAERRVFFAMVSLAAIGYFDYTYRLPRTTLVLTGVILGIATPSWFVLIRRQPAGKAERAVIVGDDPSMMATILESIDIAVVGYVSPPGVRWSDGESEARVPQMADGGIVESSLAELECLGGLSRLDDVLVSYNIDTAVLAFSRADRGEFFGTLDACYQHGVTAKVHREHADNVLTTDVETGKLIDIDVEPWDWQDYAIKRLFDIVFAVVGLIVFAPVMAAIAAAVKLDSDGPVLYRQVRTATFGGTLTVPKFRSMVTGAEAETGATLSEEDNGGTDPRVTRVGRILRETHLDELPQLWLILKGDMSVVGPRPERPALDDDIRTDVDSWRRRWFVKPGLTGLAQINDATGFEPEKKLRYDIAYIRNQSFWFDLKILIRQLWLVLVDGVWFVFGAGTAGGEQ